MKLLIDNREPKGLKELLGVRLKNTEIGNLDIGDFIIKNDNDETVMIFERKSISDLIASIKDGRYNEQSFRLSQFPLNNHFIYYIIEGNLTDFIAKNNEQTRKMVFSAMFSLSYTKGFSLLHGNGWLDTAEFLIRFMDRWTKGVPSNTNPNNAKNNNVLIQSLGATTLDSINNDVILSQSGGAVISEACVSSTHISYSDALKTSKKSNITKENIGEIMLAQIPGLSMNVAQSLMAKYKTIKNLIIELEKDQNCLDDFKIESKNGMRKINKPVIKNLKDYL